MKSKDQLLLERIYETILIKESSDEEYLGLAKNPEENEKELQKMVNEFAKKSEYHTGPLYHSSDQSFNQFDMLKIKSAEKGLIYFSVQDRKYGSMSRKFYLKGKSRYASWTAGRDRRKEGDRWKFEDGNYADETVTNEYSLKGEVGDTYYVGSPTQIKLADLVTYDDEGKVIPLSQRFNSSKNDIRY